MRRWFTSLASLALVVPMTFIATSLSASAATYSVCATGCDFSTIQSAVNAALPGDVITIGPGSYQENVVVTVPVTIDGSGSQTVVYPAFNGPTCAISPGPTLCDGSSTVFTVQANNVTIENLTIEGANPALSGGAMVGGASINARNGIVDNYNVGIFNNLIVDNVTVNDVYHRGIYEASGGTGFEFVGNHVNNVQGSPTSIGIFNFGGSGVIADNTVTNANDAISANWSTGTQFLDNTIVQSGSGVHTDNSGESGSTDLIQGNTVVNCMTDGYGIFTFAQYNTVTVANNNVHGCYIGLADFGSSISGATTTFTGNVVDGTNATTTDPTGTYGAYVITNLLGFGSGDATATFTNNSISNFGTGLFVSQTTTFYGDTPGGNATVTASNNNITKNGVGAFGDTGTSVTASSNWWGCPAGPGSRNCDSATGTVEYSPWLSHAAGRHA